MWLALNPFSYLCLLKRTTCRLDKSSTPVVAVQYTSPHAHLVNLEPVLAGAIASREGSRALVHPDHDWALGMGPLRPFGGDVRPSGDRSAELGSSTAVAAHLSIGDGHDRVVVGPLALYGLWRRGRRETRVAWIGRAANLVGSHGTMAGDEGGC